MRRAQQLILMLSACSTGGTVVMPYDAGVAPPPPTFPPYAYDATPPPMTPYDAGGSEFAYDAGVTPAPPPPVTPVGNTLCHTGTPPPGAPQPAPLPTYAGTCPALVPGMNTITSSGSQRRFILVVPENHDMTRPLPVIFAWHYLGGSASSMVNHGQVQQSANTLGFIGVAPEKKGDVGLGLGFDIPGLGLDFSWPFLTSHSDARIEEEARFFDDMLACVAQQFPVNQQCVSSVGVSAGALWTSQLMQRRADRLSSAMVLSGGIGPNTISIGAGFVDVRGFQSTAHKVPAMVLWGGTGDGCGLNFNTASTNLRNSLRSNGHFVMECVHNCGHAAPPVDDPAAGLSVLYRFAMDHPFWLSPGQSPWASTGMPPGTPSWCSIAGSPTPRGGACRSAAEGGVACPVPALK